MLGINKVNIVKYKLPDVYILKVRLSLIAILSILLCLYLIGCSDSVHLPSTKQLIEFENAGPARPIVDMDRLIRAKIGGGPYRVMPFDVLELTMPGILQMITVEDLSRTDRAVTYICRVNEAGSITLPIVDDIKVSGKTLSQIEEVVIAAYYPNYIVSRPSVFAHILEYRTAQVSISGAVQKPGIYSLRNDQMSLVALLMEAGGIIDDGAARISIVHSGKSLAGQEESVRKTLLQRRQTKPKDNAPGQVDLRLRFKQTTDSSTEGEMIIRYPDDRILLTEHLDIAREIERKVLVEKLAEIEPRVSKVEINERFCALAEQLRADSGSHRKGIETPGRIIEPFTATFTSSVFPDVTKVRNVGFYGELEPNSDNSLYKRMDETGKKLYHALHLKENPETTQESETNRPKEADPLILPVKGFNIPFADVALQDGDSVIVERLQPPLFTVMGLVNRPGNFPYPPDVRYNLAQALSFAGGLREDADPRYATIYRLKPNGGIVSAVFPIVENSKLTDAVNTSIKPGDIVAVEQTPRTRTAVFLNRIFRINIGTYWSMNDMWE